MVTSKGGQASPGLIGGIRSDFTTRAWVLIPVGIAIDAAGGTFAEALNLPLFLGNTGSILVAILCGPWVGALTGILGNVLMGLTVDPTSFAFAIAAAAIAFTAGLLARKGWYRTIVGIAAGGVVLALVATIISTPIVVLMFGGAGGSGVTTVRAFFLATGVGIWQGVFGSDLLVNLVDKLLQLSLAVAVAMAMPKRIRPDSAEKAIAGRLGLLRRRV